MWVKTEYEQEGYKVNLTMPIVNVLGKGPLNALTPTPDMDHTVSLHMKPRSHTTFMEEMRLKMK